MQKQVHVYFSGAVQGVGFRFTARELAGTLGILGWVKNLSDGRVELMAQADEDVLKEFLSRIDKHFSRYIESRDIEWLGFNQEFKDFSVKF